MKDAFAEVFSLANREGQADAGQKRLQQQMKRLRDCVGMDRGVDDREDNL
jgi:hypothetical protein